MIDHLIFHHSTCAKSSARTALPDLFHGTYGSNKFDEAIDQLLGHTVWARHQRRLGPFTTVRHRNRENVYPSAIEDVVIAADGYGGEHRIAIGYESTMDKIAIQVEYNDIPEPSLRTWVGGTPTGCARCSASARRWYWWRTRRCRWEYRVGLCREAVELRPDHQDVSEPAGAARVPARAFGPGSSARIPTRSDPVGADRRGSVTGSPDHYPSDLADVTGFSDRNATRQDRKNGAIALQEVLVVQVSGTDLATCPVSYGTAAKIEAWIRAHPFFRGNVPQHAPGPTPPGGAPVTHRG